MTDSEENLSEQESLALIAEMIDKAKNHFHESGVSAILWGKCGELLRIDEFAQNYWHFRIGFDVWLLALAAIIPQIVISIRENRRKEVRTYTETALDAIWIVYAISLFALVLYVNLMPSVTAHLLKQYDGARLMRQTISTGATEPQVPFVPSISSLFLLVYAFPTICTGIIQRFTPMLVGAIFCYGFFVASLFTINTYDFLFMGLAGICNWLIPGIILRKRYLRAKHV